MCEEWQQLLNGVKGKRAKITEHFQVFMHRYALFSCYFLMKWPKKSLLNTI